MYRLFHDPETVRTVLDEPESWPAIFDRSRLDAIVAAGRPARVVPVAYCAMTTMVETLDTRSRILAERPATEAMDENCRPLTMGVLGVSDGSGAPDRVIVPPEVRAVRLILAVEPGDREVAAIDVRVDDRLAGRVVPERAAEMPATGSAPAAGEPIWVERVVALPARESTVSFAALDTRALFSPGAQEVRFEHAEPPAAEERVLYVVAAGIDAYVGAVKPLRYAKADAAGFIERIEASFPASYYDRLEVVTLFDEEATRAELEVALAGIARSARPGDAVLIYLAGHGVADDSGYTFLTVDVTDGRASASTGLDHALLAELLAEISARNVFVFLDTCYAAAFDLRGPSNLANESGYLLLTASTAFEEALDSWDDRHGLFATAVNSGLEGEAALSDGSIDALTLGVFVRNEVPRLAIQKQHRQTAVFQASGGELADFPVAAVSR